MLKIGITGGIGSGKTYICSVFIKLGIDVYSADEQAKFLMNFNSKLKKEITDLFGKEAYSGQILNRKFISEIVFKNKEMLERLNALVHPAVANDFRNWCKTRIKKAYILHEAAILFESGTDKKMDKNIVVIAPEEVRINRVIERDKTDSFQVKARILNQWPADKLMQLADFVIENDNKKLILPQILQIDQFLKREWQNSVNG